MLPDPTFDSEYVEVRKSPVHGKGLCAKSRLSPGLRIADYKGHEYHITEYKNKYKCYQYCYTMNRIHKVLDGRPFLTQNPSHYCNESLTPNVALRKKGLFTLREIEPNEELFLSYPHFYTRDYSLK